MVRLGPPGTFRRGEQGLDGEGNALGLQIESQHLHLHRLTHAEGIGGVLHVTVGDLGEMHETVLMDAHIHEGAEVSHVRDDALELHADLQVAGLVHALAELDDLELVPGIATGLLQFGQDVLHGLDAEAVIHE
jgi:hypothetical protein